MGSVVIEPCNNPLAKNFVVDFVISNRMAEHLDNIRTEHENGAAKFDRIGEVGTKIIKEIFASYSDESKLLLFIYPRRILVVVSFEEQWPMVEALVTRALVNGSLLQS